jgi:hypothetical protein
MGAPMFRQPLASVRDPGALCAPVWSRDLEGNELVLIIGFTQISGPPMSGLKEDTMAKKKAKKKAKK